MTRQQWTDELVLEAIRARHAAGKPLTYMAAVREDEALTGAARKRFGSWPAALAAAGFDPAEHKAPRVARRRWDEVTVIREIQAAHAAGHDMDAHATQLRDGSLVSSARSYFGGWDAALLAAGLDPAEHRRTSAWSKQRVIDAIRKAHRNGADLADRTVAALAPDLYGAAATHMGGWRQAVEAAGLVYDDVRRTRTHTRATLLDAVRELADAGIPIGQLAAVDGAWGDALRQHFGSVPAAIAAAGVDDLPPAKVERGEDVLNRLRDARGSMSQTKLGEAVDRSHRAIGLYESGELVPSLACALRLARELGHPVEDLFTLPD